MENQIKVGQAEHLIHDKLHSTNILELRSMNEGLIFFSLCSTIYDRLTFFALFLCLVFFFKDRFTTKLVFTKKEIVVCSFKPFQLGSIVKKIIPFKSIKKTYVVSRTSILASYTLRVETKDRNIFSIKGLRNGYELKRLIETFCNDNIDA